MNYKLQNQIFHYKKTRYPESKENFHEKLFVFYLDLI